LSADGRKDAVGLSVLSRDVVRSALVDVVSKALVAGTAAVLGLIALLVWTGGSVPVWVAVVVALLAAATVFIARRQVRRLRHDVLHRDEKIAELSPATERVPELEYEVACYVSGLERHELYAAHVAKVLDHLQRVVIGDIGVPIPQYIERGIL
jgi:hypothetical protein